MMIVEYHRPQDIDTALDLLARPEVKTVPLGGGTAIKRDLRLPTAVVDLQDLHLDEIRALGTVLEVGATATLQALLEDINVSSELKKVIRHEATYNLRQVATAAGTLVAADGRSPFATVFHALDAQLKILPPSGNVVNIGDLLPLREDILAGRLITWIKIPLNVRLAYEYIARSPADRPIVCVAVAQWQSSRTRVVLGGYGEAPVLAFDGMESGGAEIAARSAYYRAKDEWATEEYRQEMAAVLTKRCLHSITSQMN